MKKTLDMATEFTTTGKVFLKLAKFANKLSPFSKKTEVNATHGGYQYGHSWSLYDGEKSLGEIGPAKNYQPNYNILRIRSWQSYLESEISQTILNKYKTWIIGKGLTLQCEPADRVLKSEGIKQTNEEFTQLVEDRFFVYANSSDSDYTGMRSLNLIADDVFKNSKIGGDVLVVLHYINNQVKVQVIDGCHVQSPTMGIRPVAGGGFIYNGIEMSSTGEHIAYHLRIDGKPYKVPAVNNGIRSAFMVYGSRYRLDNHRGLPHIAVALETIKKLERYKEAMVGSAEERAKIAVVQETKTQGTGESVFQKHVMKAIDAGANSIPTDVHGTTVADSVVATTNKQLINMPIDSSLKFLSSDTEFSFKEFYETNINLLCSALEIPPNVAMSIYNDSFSASRAATKDWEHTIGVKRSEFSQSFYQRVYKFWFITEVLKNKIPAPGFIKAFEEGNNMIVDSYLNSRWTGAMFPHIDPLKEVNAERAKLGSDGAHLPLTTVENATEVLGSGDSEANISQFAREKTKAELLGIKPKQTVQEKTKKED